MKTLETLLQYNKSIRAIGYNDTPFNRTQDNKVNISGIVCLNTRFEGMLWSEVTLNGMDATETVAEQLINSTFYPHIHVLLFDGISMAGLNIIDLPLLTKWLARPCISVMRELPNMRAIQTALTHLSDTHQRFATMCKAGNIHKSGDFYFQVQGTSPGIAAATLHRLSDQYNMPEALRIAQLIGAAVKTGHSSTTKHLQQMPCMTALLPVSSDDRLEKH
ncbi:DUF99 family protein [Zooshikella marina]|uniref:DUF99 family protein n=1 Tax=Zooshikella ganghwensis TaxID=202772 RepID=A0A4P9VQK3_9GAMM|nr:DUF99 family protein [Zooshikella ganghwensis]MBU2704869.1 DUF99 family protein [Zooshikella ganghwensis]RDH45306.1 DUF99 family protein [Zooshikella ganghwensis]